MHPGHTGFTLPHKLTVPEHQVRCTVRSLWLHLAVDVFTYGPFNVQHKPVSLDVYNSVHMCTAGLKCSRCVRAIACTQFIYVYCNLRVIEVDSYSTQVEEMLEQKARAVEDTSEACSPAQSHGR